MPFRLDEHRAKVQFVTSNRMPSLIYRAAKNRGIVSNTRYIQEALCERLSVDLGIPLADLLAELPPPRGNSATLLHGRTPRRGREFVNEQVR